MTTLLAPKAPQEKSFVVRYRSALAKYISRRDEHALQAAYELSRKGIESGTSLVEVASAHHKVLSELAAAAKSSPSRADILAAGAEFFAEFLSPYEMAYRGFGEAVEALRYSNETLEEKIRKIAHDVHDEAGQFFVGVHLSLAELGREYPQACQTHIPQIEKLLKQVEEQLRRLSHELRPAILDDLGWVPAIRFLADSVTKRTRLAIYVRADFAERLPGPVEIALYRAVQETLTNAAKHAKASRVVILANLAGSTLSCEIDDDGVGFDPNLAQSAQSGGLGLLGMRERIRAVGGSLRIESAPGQGTRVSMSVPIT